MKSSKQKFDRLKVDCIQKIDLLAAARCNMYSHALVTYQDSLTNFCEKIGRTYSHVEQSFKGYQPYDFQYIKELADTSGMFNRGDRKNRKAVKTTDKQESEKSNQAQNENAPKDE